MVDYEYYVNCYLGSLIPERSFSALAKRAGEYLDKLRRTYLVRGGEDATAMAICAVAEQLHRTGKSRGIASASIGGVSIRYLDAGEKALLREMYRAASVYLDIYRGKELCKANGVSAV